jgi:Fe-S-cluster containining protein
MARIRLAIIGPSPCERCDAACCKQNGCGYSVLLEPEEYARFRPFALDLPVLHDGRVVVEMVLPYRDGKCIFLGDDDRCTIYEDRPASCRKFECTKYFNNGGSTPGRHEAFIERNPRVKAMLEEW